jgi:hypothetical protein
LPLPRPGHGKSINERRRTSFRDRGRAPPCILSVAASPGGRAGTPEGAARGNPLPRRQTLYPSQLANESAPVYDVHYHPVEPLSARATLSFTF